MSEESLLKKIKENPVYFSEIFQQYYKSIFGYVLRRTGNFDDTADIAAVSFFKAYNNIKNFSFKGISIKIWLYRIATNEINMYFRVKRKHALFFTQLSFDDKSSFETILQNDRQLIEAELQNHQQFNSVLNHLKTLRSKYQEVIALKYFEGKDNKEIAAILSINEGTLKSLLSRGIKKLKEKCNQL